MNLYGDIGSRTAAKAMVPLLQRMLPELVIERFGQQKELGRNETKQVIFRRAESLEVDPASRTLSEGVTPAGQSLTFTDIPATLKQMGDFVPISDVIIDTHEDPILKETMALIGEQCVHTIERDRANTLRASTNRYFANGATIGAVNTPITRELHRRVTRGLRAQNVAKFSRISKASAAWGSQAVQPSIFAICHTDVEDTIRDISPKFKAAEDYGSLKPIATEFGSYEGVRYLTSTHLVPAADAGGTAGDNISSGGTNADVYPVIYFGMNAYGIVPLTGKGAIHPMVHNPTVSDSDKLAQRGHVGWKSYQTSVILNDLWMAVAWVSVPN